MSQNPILTIGANNALVLQPNNARTIEIDLTTLDTAVEAGYRNIRGIGIVNRQTGEINTIISDENGIVTVDVSNLPAGTEFTTVTLSDAANLNRNNLPQPGEQIVGRLGQNGGYVFSRNDGTVINTAFPDNVGITSIPDLNPKNMWREIFTANPDLVNTIGLRSEDLYSPTDLRRTRPAESLTLPEGTTIPQGAILDDDITVRTADGSTRVIPAGTRFDQAYQTSGQNTISGDYDDLKQAVIEVRITQALEPILRETVERYENRDRTVIETPVEEVRTWSEEQTTTVVEQLPITTGFDPVNFAQRDSETGELTIADEGYAASAGSEGIGVRYSWVLNNPIRVTETTEQVPGQPIPGEPIVESLNFENGVLRIPQGVTGDINFSPREGVSMFNNNPPVIIALDANGNPLRAITANRDGSMSLDSEFLEGAAGVTTAIVPNGGNNNLEVGKVYDVRESGAYDGFALFDGDREITGDARSGASLISANAALNPGGRPMTVSEGNVVSFEDNAGRGQWRSDFDLNDYTVEVNGNTYTPTLIPTTETVVRRDIELDPVVYAGVQGSTDMNSSVSVGAHIGIEGNPLRVNDQGQLEANTGPRLFADAQVDVGVAPQITTEITTITDFEGRREGLTTEVIETMQQGEVRTVVNETTGEIVSVTRLEGDQIEVSRTSSTNMGEEQVRITGQRTEINQSESLGVVSSVTGRLGVKFGVDPNIAQAGDVNARVYVEGQAQTNGSASLSAVGEGGLIIDANGSSSTSLNAQVRQGLAGDNAGDTQFSVQLRHGGNSGNSQGPSGLTEDAIRDFQQAQSAAIQNQANMAEQFAGLEDLLDFNLDEVSFTEVEGLSSPLGTGQTPQAEQLQR